MIASENLKNSEIIEDFDYLEADEAFPDFPDDENLDDLGFSDDPEGEENTYLSMKDTDNIDKQVVERYSSFAKRAIDPLQERTQKLEEDTKLSAEVQEQNEENRNIMEKNNIAINDLVKRILILLTPEKIEENTKKQVEIAKEELGKFLNDGYADAFMIIKTQVENFVDKIIEDKFVEAEKRLDVKLEACRLAEERLDKKEEELNKKQEEIQQKIDEFLALQDAKKEEVEEMINSLTAQNAAAQEVIASERKNSLHLKNLIDEQKNIINIKDEQIEKVLIDNREKEKQISQILAQNEQIIEENKKKDDRRREEIQEQNEEIKKLRQVMIRKEEKMGWNYSFLTVLICIVIMFWGFVGLATTPELHNWINTFVKIISWTSIGVGFVGLAFKILKGGNK